MPNVESRAGEPAPPALPSPARVASRSDPKGIGGWMLLPMIGLTLSPFVTIAYLYEGLQEGGGVESLSALYSLLHADPGLIVAAILRGEGGSYAVLAVSLTFVLATMILGVGGPIALWVLAYQRSALFPPGMIMYLVGTALLNAAYFPLAQLGFVDYDPIVLKDLGRSIFACCIWVPYFLVSVRVRNTFVN